MKISSKYSVMAILLPKTNFSSWETMLIEVNPLYNAFYYCLRLRSNIRIRYICWGVIISLPMSINFTGFMISAKGDIPQKYGKISQTFLTICLSRQLSIVVSSVLMVAWVHKFWEFRMYAEYKDQHKFHNKALYAIYFGQIQMLM